MPRQKIPDAIRELKEQVRFLKKQIPKKPFGRPEMFTAEQVQMLERICGFPGITEEQVAWLLNCHKDTVLKFIKRKYGCTFTEFRAQKEIYIDFLLLNKQVEVALKGDKTLLVWLGKARLGQKETTETVLKNQGEPTKLIIEMGDSLQNNNE